MPIEDRIYKVDLNTAPVNTDFRAAIHQKLSETAINFDRVKSQLNHSLVLPLNPALTSKLHEIHSWWFANAGDRELISLSPLGVFGIDQLITETSPLKIAHLAGQPMDVVADPTIQLAVEAYRRRRGKDNSDIQLGAFHTCTRLQAYSGESYKPTFEMFGTLDSRSKDPSHEFESTSIRNIIDNYTALIGAVYADQTIKVEIGNLNIAQKLISNSGKPDEFGDKKQAVDEKLPRHLKGQLPISLLNKAEFADSCDKVLITSEVNQLKKLVGNLSHFDDANISFCLDRVYGIGHYKGLAFTMFVGGVDIVDGGVVDWVKNLSSNSREKTVVSGMGTQLLADLVLARNQTYLK